MNTTKELKTKETQDIEIFRGYDSGFEGTEPETFKTPFVRILQMLSPELKKSDPKYLPKAEAGLFCNSATQELYKQLNVIVLKVEHSLIVWKPDRGGFVGRYPKFKESEIVESRDGLKKWDSDGNEIIDTIEFHCLNAEEPSDIFIFPVSTASLKHGKSFATRLRLLKSQGTLVNVSWAGIWKISTVEESNEKGSWFTIGTTPEFVRFIKMEERDSFVVPAIDMLKSSVIDYRSIEPSQSEQTGEDPSF